MTDDRGRKEDIDLEASERANELCYHIITSPFAIEVDNTENESGVRDDNVSKDNNGARFNRALRSRRRENPLDLLHRSSVRLLTSSSGLLPGRDTTSDANADRPTDQFLPRSRPRSQ